MTSDVERFIRIQKPTLARRRDDAQWRTLPNAERVRVWEMSIADALEDDKDAQAKAKRYMFHIGFVDLIVRGCRVTYLGEHFIVLGVSDSTRLRGLELRCVPEAMYRG